MMLLNAEWLDGFAALQCQEIILCSMVLRHAIPGNDRLFSSIAMLPNFEQQSQPVAVATYLKRATQPLLVSLFLSTRHRTAWGQALHHANTPFGPFGEGIGMDGSDLLVYRAILKLVRKFGVA